MLIAHNSSSSSGGGGDNLVPSGLGSDGINDIQAGPHRKLHDGEGSGPRKKDEGQAHEGKEQVQENKVIPSPTKNPEEGDKYDKY